MSYVIINKQNHPTDTEKDVLSARFQMACAGLKELPVFFGEPDSPDSYQSETIRIAVDDLQNLLELLREVDRDIEADLSNLPTFGGEEPRQTLEVWSWDADHLLVGSCIDDMKIVDREEWEGGAE